MHFLEEDGSSEVLDTFVINEEYARRYEHNKAREELHRCKFSVIFMFFFFIILWNMFLMSFLASKR